MLPKGSNCSGCVLETLGTGFMVPGGKGNKEVCIIGEALGQEEAEKGEPFVGKSGFTLDKLLTRAGLERDDFWITNSCYCRPPQNKLAGMWYMQPALDHCADYLDSFLAEKKPKCIVTLGVTAFRRILPEIAANHKVGLLDSAKTKGVVGYVHWSEKYKTWVICAPHPSFILRGQTAWAQSLIYCLQRGVEIARDGFDYEEGDYTLDCTPAEAHAWVDEFEQYALSHPGTMLSCDIETPEKDGDESELDLEDRVDYIILRCGYSYKDHHALSIPWDGPYKLVHQRLLSHPCDKIFWNAPFDVPRILAAK